MEGTKDGAMFAVLELVGAGECDQDRGVGSEIKGQVSGFRVKKWLVVVIIRGRNRMLQNNAVTVAQ